MLQFAFIMDQQVGLRTQALNYEQAVACDGSIQATWVPVHYAQEAGLLTRLPGVPEGIKGTLRGVREIRDALGGNAGRFDAMLWATWAAKSVPDLVAAAPSVLVMDMTPMQMEAMGERYGYTRGRARFLGGWKRRATDRLYAEARHLFPWNEWVARSLREDYGVPGEKVTPICPGVDLGLFKPDKNVKPDDGVVRLLFVGGDFERKGGDLLLRWAGETGVKSPWELHLVTRDSVPETPGVIVHRGIANNSPELARLYQQSDLFVLPTRADCYSLVAMEAMAAGLPVVITRLGGIPELINEGETGYLLAADDYDALHDRLDTVVADAVLRARLGEAALRRATTHYDSRANIGKVLAAMKAASH